MTTESESKDHRRALGYRGEQLAAEYMVEKGWELLAQNYTTDIGELDLVMHRQDTVYGRTEETIVFVEVKTKQNSVGPPPEASVNHKKRSRLARLGKLFLQLEDIRRVNARFDVIAVAIGGEEPTIMHFPGAFDADARIW